MQHHWPEMPLLPVSWGEVFDKMTILQIKVEKFSGSEKLVNVERELCAIAGVVGDLQRFPAELQPCMDELKRVNGRLWDVEDGKRECERQRCFDDHFVQLAREVYFGNDQRAAIKRQINALLGSAIVEEKSYNAY
jgi:Family of unknown function (DUF6165)